MAFTSAWLALSTPRRPEAFHVPCKIVLFSSSSKSSWREMREKIARNGTILCLHGGRNLMMMMMMMLMALGVSRRPWEALEAAGGWRLAAGG